eukprot:COSAG01_NODE_2893_length_6905_cov_4.717455_5_plen_53_part_00
MCVLHDVQRSRIRVQLELCTQSFPPRPLLLDSAPESCSIQGVYTCLAIDPRE